jgi:hypothetical protein
MKSGVRISSVQFQLLLGSFRNDPLPDPHQSPSSFETA